MLIIWDDKILRHMGGTYVHPWTVAHENGIFTYVWLGVVYKWRHHLRGRGVAERWQMMTWWQGGGGKCVVSIWALPARGWGGGLKLFGQCLYGNNTIQKEASLSSCLTLAIRMISRTLCKERPLWWKQRLPRSSLLTKTNKFLNSFSAQHTWGFIFWKSSVNCDAHQRQQWWCWKAEKK